MTEQQQIQLREQFIQAAKPLIQFLCENFNPHVSVIVTPTGAEIVAGVMATGEILDYIRD